jgi:hypothetical protein
MFVSYYINTIAFLSSENLNHFNHVYFKYFIIFLFSKDYGHIIIHFLISRIIFIEKLSHQTSIILIYNLCLKKINIIFHYILQHCIEII